MTVVNNKTISVVSTEAVPANVLLKTYNFFGYVTASLVTAQSPQYTWPVNIYDTCAAAYNMVFATFADMNVSIGVPTGTTQTKTFS